MAHAMHSGRIATFSKVFFGIEIAQKKRRVRSAWKHQQHPGTARSFETTPGIPPPARKPKRFSLTAEPACLPCWHRQAEAAEESEIFPVNPGTTVLQSRNPFSSLDERRTYRVWLCDLGLPVRVRTCLRRERDRQAQTGDLRGERSGVKAPYEGSPRDDPTWSACARFPLPSSPGWDSVRRQRSLAPCQYSRL